MSAFYPSGNSAVLAYADDSAVTVLGFADPAPTHLAVFNPDAANVITVTASFTQFDAAAVVPTSDQNGVGLVVGPGDTAYYALSSTAGSEDGNLYVSVAGASTTGNVFITPGIYEPVVYKGY